MTLEANDDNESLLLLNATEGAVCISIGQKVTSYIGCTKCNVLVKTET